MRKRIIHLIIAFIICSCAFLPACFVTSCDRRRMTEFYSNDSNYEVIVGKITYSNLTYDGERFIWLESEERTYSLSIVSASEMYLNEKGVTLEVGEELFSITTSTETWWNGWVFPVVAITRIADNEELLDFDTGKANLLYWIQYKLH